MFPRFVGVALIVGTLAAAPAEPVCPPAAEIERALLGVDLASASRLARFDEPLPDGLYRSAARQVGRAVAANRENRAFGVLVVERPIELLWKALNDEDHHALDGRYVPVRASRVIEGAPRGPDRLLFQTFQQMGVGRWWVNRMWMNRDLYATSRGRLWELTWEDRMAEVDRTRPPVSEAASTLAGIESSRGSWLLFPLGENCTVMEQFSWTDAGGILGATQRLLAGKGMRDTLEGLVRLADEHVAAVPHPGPPFVRPDGTPIE